MRHDWKTKMSRKDGTPRLMELNLAPGCDLTLNDVVSTVEQGATLKLQLNGVNYSKTIRRPRPENETIEAAQAWAEESARAHIRVLVDLARQAASALDG